MGLKATYMQMVLVSVIALARVGAAAAATDQALPGCSHTCGNVSIPYPFGIGKSSDTGENCFLEEELELTCNNSSLYHGHGKLQILNITLEGQMDMLFFVSKVCNDGSGFDIKTKGNEATIGTPAFAISSEDNKFVSVGCDTYGILNSFQNDHKYSTGCLTSCDSISDMKTRQRDGNCTGIGCCQVDIPPGMNSFSIQAFSFYNFMESWSFNNCSYSFLAKKGNYSFSLDHLNRLPFEEFPFVVDWTVGNETCEVSQSRHNSACRNNSYCEDSSTGYGYRCKCNKGYEGNPYHPDGCQDIKECKNGKHDCISEHNCRETEGSFECFCPDGQSGNGKWEGEGCQQNQRDNVLTKVVTGISSSFGSIILLLGLWWLFKVVRKNIVKKRKEKFFKQNGGLLLEQRLSSSEVNVDKSKLFSLKDLEKATNHFNMNRVLGKGGQGTVYKGMLVDGKIVAVKKFKVQGNVEEFINEFVILSQINHRNVVKLLGCCLETEIPLLVYEFIPNGNLYEYLHDRNEDLPMTWDMRLRIAIEVAGALFYLHSVASQPIYHRDIKSTNILLDEKYRAKVADFGTSRMVSIEATHLTTVVQGTFGYLDPEYFHTSQFTEKSDVYSFGVVLVELLTGQRPISSLRPQEAKSLASYFILSMEEDRLFDIIDERVMKEGEKEHIIAVANLANRCIELNGKKRPSMKEVTMELEGIQKLERNSNAEQNHEEIQLARIEDYQTWAAYSASNTGPTLNNRIPVVEVMPFLIK